MYGWCGKIARIDLTSQTWEVEKPDISIYHNFIGGRGLAGYYLSPHIHRKWHAAEMPLLIFAGPLTGTSSPTPGRSTFMSRSPLTGTIGDSSVGGCFGTELKKAGFDGLIITGSSHRIIGLEITNTSVQFVPADAIHGMTSSQVQACCKDHGSVAAIGPAAENGVRFSNIIIDGHYAAGRNGLGLIFAGKKLKYIAVTGTGKIRIFDPEKLKDERENIRRLMAASPAIFGRFGISAYGTGALYDLMDARNMMPTDNFQKTRFVHASSMNAHAYEKQFKPRKTGCRGCHVQCKKITDSGRSIPEFETMSHFSALINNHDREVVMEANRICNEMGMDTISAASVLACRQEISGKRIPSQNIVGALLEIAHGKGEYANLGMGSARLARSCGRPDAAITVKQQDLSAYDPRGAMGMALAFAVSTRGACHLRAYPISHEILRKPVATDRFRFTGKARIIKINEDVNAVADSLTACKFTFFAASLEEYAAVFAAVTGHSLTGQDLLKTGERICYHERMMNAKNGFSRKDDDLPPRFFCEPETSQSAADLKPIDRKAFQKAVSDYYTVRGLDQDGMPVAEKIKELGLDGI
ncbi:MAG: aldehyde ferredoxin oxidoreductase family protein [Pseudomonadota bacterium]